MENLNETESVKEIQRLPLNDGEFVICYSNKFVRLPSHWLRSPTEIVEMISLLQKALEVVRKI